MACETLQQETTCKGRENSKLQGLKRQEGSEEFVWIAGNHIQGLIGHSGAKALGCERHCFDMCGIAKHADDIPGQSRKSSLQQMT